MAAQNDNRAAVNDLIHALRDVFKKYSRSSRRKAWNKVKDHAGEAVIDKLINNPSFPLRGLDRLIFKEWLKNHPD